LVKLDIVILRKNISKTPAKLRILKKNIIDKRIKNVNIKDDEKL
jgi:hypothetical protein